MNNKLLTTLQLKAITVADIGKILNDGGGLRGRVRKNRSGNVIVFFEYKYRDGQKSKTTKIGTWPDKSLAEIRSQCQQVKAKLSEGYDPNESRKAERLDKKLEQSRLIEQQQAEIERIALEKLNQRTFKQAIEQWHAHELKRRKDAGQETMRALEKDILPALSDVPLNTITRSHILDLLDQVVARGALVMANHLFTDLKQFFNFAIAREWVQSHPLAGLTKDKIGGRQKERDRVLSETEIVELKHKLSEARLLQTTEISLWIMLSTCCRVGELSQAKWEHIDFDTQEWHIPAGNSKNAKPHTVLLSAFAMNQFRALFKITANSVWCLPSRNHDEHVCLKSITKQIKDRVRETPLKNRSNATATLLLSGGAWTPHDLRRTGATLMGELGVMGEVIERCLNHIETNKLKRTYQRHELKERQREAWLLLGDRLELLLSENNTDKVVVANFR